MKVFGTVLFENVSLQQFVRESVFNIVWEGLEKILILRAQFGRFNNFKIICKKCVFLSRILQSELGFVKKKAALFSLRLNLSLSWDVCRPL